MVSQAPFNVHASAESFLIGFSYYLDFQGGQVLFTKGAESAILPFTTSGEIEKTRLHVDEFALVRIHFFYKDLNKIR